MNEKDRREFMPLKKYTFPAGECGGEIRVNIPAIASKYDVIQMAKMLMVVAEDWTSLNDELMTSYVK